MSLRVLIIGGGFCGLEVARRLRLASDVDVTLVEPSSHALFTPRLVDALAQACSETDLRFPHATIAQRRGYAFVQGKATYIDKPKKTVTVERAGVKTVSLKYDVLVCAQGAETNFFQLEGKELVFPFKTWEHLLALEEQLQPLTRKKTPFNITLIGGGATGIEIAFALHRRLEKLGISPKRRSLTIFDAGPQILSGFLPRTIMNTLKLIKANGFTLRTSTPAASVQDGQLTTRTGEIVPTDLVIWGTGIQANKIETDVPNLDPKGALAVDYALRTEPNVYAGGDVIQFKDNQRIIPKNAQTALKMGKAIADNILREKAGKEVRAFTYRSLGVLLWLDQTTGFDLLGVSLLSPLFTWMRKTFYTRRWKQMIGE